MAPTCLQFDTPQSVIPLLERCGYTREHIVEDYPLDDVTGVVAFARAPHDARTTCIAIARAGESPEKAAMAWRSVGAPVVLLLADNAVEWWQPRTDKVVRRETFAATKLTGFFDRHREELAPERLYRAKSCSRLRPEYQLEFVDIGLLPFVEAEMGNKLSRLLENMLKEGGSLAGKAADEEQAARRFHWMFESVFLLLAGKILHDKTVPGFQKLDVGCHEAVITRVRKHYGQGERLRAGENWRHDFLEQTAQRVAALSPLTNLTTETLAHIYENTLVSPETRRRLGTHSTPGYLIDYVVWSLADWIREIPDQRRHVYEPCCGHAGFLIAAMRLLRDMGPELPTPAAAHQYLQQRLHGFETDAFALEIARLGLTLADVPNPNGWDLRAGDIFASEWPKAGEPAPDIILMNPPFENFQPSERKPSAGHPHAGQYLNKTAEVISRILPKLNPGGVFGLVVPQCMLHQGNCRPIRQMICNEFELQEITLLPDGVFSVSDAESAILLGRRRPATPATMVRIGRVDEKQGLKSFQEREALSEFQYIKQQRFISDKECNFRIPRLDDVWSYLSGLPKLGMITAMGKGLTHKGTDALNGITVVAQTHFPNAVKGFVKWSSKQMLHEQPAEAWISLAPETVSAFRSGKPTGRSQLVLNYSRVKRSPWRLKALIDTDGHAINSRFIAIRPFNHDLPLEFFWALLTSPVAHSYAFCHFDKRDNKVSDLKAMPVPKMRQEDIARVTNIARQYLELARRSPNPSQQMANELHSRMLQLDAEILRLYDLTPRMERRLLNLFSGHERLGVPFKMNRYFPIGFTPCIPLHNYLSPEYQRSRAGELHNRIKDFNAPHVIAALRAASEAFDIDGEA